MIMVVQRVLTASVTVEGSVVSKIGRGFLVLAGVCVGDTMHDAEVLAEKCTGLRIFEDAAEKMNLGLSDVAGEILAVSNFTLCADCSHGRRPSFSNAARPEDAQPVFDRFVEVCRERGIPTQTGVFGADMKVEISNDGPVTLIVDSKDLRA
ncbi:MAG: D-tyrosyl-tRNA(Tyr) deacylase [Clostridiales bacterium]|nr:D-tyrosyl-tRNA(Tyr) deacylase [Clostridiales bacterium]